MNATRYPLAWPAGWQRTQNPERSRFEPGSPSREARLVIDELYRLGATDVVISSNLEYRPDGMPYARQPRLDDTGVAVYFKRDGSDQCIPCDKWVSVEENLRAIWKTIEALRGLDRWGAKETVNAAFRGFTALPESIIVGEHTARAWWEVLEISPYATPGTIKAAYKSLLHKAHPDHGGTQYQFEELQKAYKEATI